MQNDGMIIIYYCYKIMNMKKIISTFGFLIILFITSCKIAKPTDSVKIAETKNDAKAEQGTVNQDVADFLVQAADARMMDSKEGALATKKGVTEEIKNYGVLMIKEQALLFDEIKRLALARHITLPAETSADKKDGFADLNSKEGKDFDNKFIKMMKIDHERDIKAFAKASTLPDKEVNQFAAKYIVMIQSHLDKINAVKEMQ